MQWPHKAAVNTAVRYWDECLTANNQKMRCWNRWNLSNLLGQCQSTRGILTDKDIWIFGRCMDNIPTTLERLIEANLSKHDENHWNFTVGCSLCFLHKWKHDTHPNFNASGGSTVQQSIFVRQQADQGSLPSMFTKVLRSQFEMFASNLLCDFSENSDPGWSKHRKEHLMASVAGQEVCGGVPAHAGDPSHKHPLELQK